MYNVLCFAMIKLHENSLLFALFFEVFGFLPRNRLVGMMVPPGDASALTQFLGFVMIFLASR